MRAALRLPSLLSQWLCANASNYLAIVHGGLLRVDVQNETDKVIVEVQFLNLYQGKSSDIFGHRAFP